MWAIAFARPHFSEGAVRASVSVRGEAPVYQSGLRIKDQSKALGPFALAACALACLAVARVASGAVPWHQSLYLPNGGYWPERVSLTITNSSLKPVTGEPLALSVPELSGARVESLRVCRTDGVELLYDLRDGHGVAKRTEQLTADDKLVVPVECAARAATTLFAYAGNAEAWAVPDFLTANAADRAGVGSNAELRISVGSVERLRLRSARPTAKTPDKGWRNWAEVRVRNFDENAVSTTLVRVNLRKALTELPDVPKDSTVRVLSSQGLEASSYRLGHGANLLFSAALAPTTEEFFQAGFSDDLKHGIDGLNLDDYARLMASKANLVRNASFEDGADRPSPWHKPAEGGPHRVTAGLSSDARFGKRSLELTVLENAQADWLGWDSGEIPVKPGATYLLSGWLKGIKLQSWAAIHAHFHDTNGALARAGAMVSTLPTVNGDSDWINSSGFFQAPPDAATIQIHLTMNTQGTLRHDGIILCEVVDGEVAAVHSAAEKTARARLQVWQVNPLVKVFPHTPPRERVKAVSVELARNEFQAVQLAFRAGTTNAGKASIEVSPLKSRSGEELPPVKVERVGYVPVDHPSAYYSTEVPDWCRKVPHGAGSTDGWAGWWPDPLQPGSAPDLSPGKTQPIWFTVHAPKGAAPGQVSRANQNQCRQR